MASRSVLRQGVLFGLGMVAVILAACAGQAEGETAGDPVKVADAAVTERRPSLHGELGPDVPGFWVRPGYRVDLVADGLPNARFMVFDDKGNLLLSRPNSADILLLEPRGSGYAHRSTFLRSLPQAHGMQWKDGWLWYPKSGGILRSRDTNADGVADETQTIIPEGTLTPGGGHWWRSILVTEDSIYTSIGDSGNITDERDTERQKIWRFDLQGGNRRLFASGLRNTEKLQIRPGTNEIWGCDHGSDWFGEKLGDRQGRQPITDLNPPCEFNHYVEGGFYGHPFLVGDRVPRIEYQNRADIMDLAERTIPPAWSFGAHWGPNGFCFVQDGRRLPPDHRGDAFVALHGSWNRKVRAGYRVERVLFDKVTGRPYGAQAIVTTLDEKSLPLARPVDVVETPAGDLLFSDDLRGRIYRITQVVPR